MAKTSKKPLRKKIPKNPTFVTPRDAAGELACSLQTIYRLVQAGELQGAKVGGRFKIPRRALDVILHRITGSNDPAPRSALAAAPQETSHAG